jgi:hypothetical protein
MMENVDVDNCSALGGGSDKGGRQFCKGTYSEPWVMVAERNNDCTVGIDGPTKFRGLRQLIMIKTAIVA